MSKENLISNIFLNALGEELVSTNTTPNHDSNNLIINFQWVHGAYEYKLDGNLENKDPNKTILTLCEDQKEPQILEDMSRGKKITRNILNKIPISHHSADPEEWEIEDYDQQLVEDLFRKKQLTNQPSYQLASWLADAAANKHEDNYTNLFRHIKLRINHSKTQAFFQQCSSGSTYEDITPLFFLFEAANHKFVRKNIRRLTNIYGAIIKCLENKPTNITVDYKETYPDYIKTSMLSLSQHTLKKALKDHAKKSETQLKPLKLSIQKLPWFEELSASIKVKVLKVTSRKRKDPPPPEKKPNPQSQTLQNKITELSQEVKMHKNWVEDLKTQHYQEEKREKLIQSTQRDQIAKLGQEVKTQHALINYFMTQHRKRGLSKTR